jgi:TatD DNase family protein
MQLIDTHCHLFLDEFDNDRDEIIRNSIVSGIERIINPNVDAFTLHALQNTCQINPDVCLPAYGLHPCSVKEDFKSQLAIINEHIKHNKPIAIGEIGIDLYWDETFVEFQKIALEEQLIWASELKLPVIIHNRDAFDVMFSIVQRYPMLNGVFHAFSGSIEQVLKALDTNYFIGIGGVVTFKNSGLDKVVHDIPLDRIVLETDAPYLTPTPHRGKRNEPSYLKIIAAKIAEVKNISIEEVAKVTTQNAKRLFGI